MEWVVIILLVLLGLSAAFDTINMGILDRLSELEMLGDAVSNPRVLCYGDAQNSIISLLLFMKRLGEVIW